jgi:putative oxidoreductase
MAQGNRANAGLLVLRVVGALVVVRSFKLLFGGESTDSGIAPLERLVAGFGVPAPTAVAWIVALSVLLAGICVTIGFFARLAALVLAALIVLIVADGAGNADLLEFRLTYIAAFVAIALLGAGDWSGDGQWRQGRGG